VADSGSVGEKGFDGDRVERVLSAQKRRVLRALLDTRVIPADPILREGEVLHAEEYLTVCYELHHVLLPELADTEVSSSTGPKTRCGEARDSTSCGECSNGSTITTG